MFTAKTRILALQVMTIAAGLIVASQVPSALAADFSKGLSAYSSRDYATALEEWQPLAEQGNAGCQFYLGEIYNQGLGVSLDKEKAVYWYTQSAEHGIADAQLKLGLMYDKGLGVTQDSEKATYWLTKAAEQGYAQAQSRLKEIHSKVSVFSQGKEESITQKISDNTSTVTDDSYKDDQSIPMEARMYCTSGIYWLKHGDPAKAYEYLKHAITVYPDFTVAKQKLPEAKTAAREKAISDRIKQEDEQRREVEERRREAEMRRQREEERLKQVLATPPRTFGEAIERAMVEENVHTFGELVDKLKANRTPEEIKRSQQRSNACMNAMLTCDRQCSVNAYTPIDPQCVQRCQQAGCR